MAKAINRLSYIISGLCFSLIILLGAGYVKFLSVDPGSVTVDIKHHDSKYYAELIVEHNEVCHILADYPYARIDYKKHRGNVWFPIESSNVVFIPISIKYECNFLMFHKAGTEMVYAQVN